MTLMETTADTMFDISETVSPDEIAMLTEIDGWNPIPAFESRGVPISIQDALGWNDNGWRVTAALEMEDHRAF